jgi:hypothetical protein
MRLLLLGLVLLAFPQEPPDIESLIRKLGASDIAEREAAAKTLVERGQSVRPFLDAAAAGRDGEIASRAKAILAQLDRHVDATKIVLDRIWKEPVASYHRALRESTHAVRVATEGKTEAEVLESLRKQGITLHPASAPPHGAKGYLGKKDAYVAPGGIRHDLLLSLDVVPETSKTEATKRIVRSSSVLLVARVSAEFTALGPKSYPAGTPFQLAVEDEVNGNVAGLFPILVEITARYCLVYPSHRESNAFWGFEVDFQFANRAKTAGKSTSTLIQSGLDPAVTDGVTDEAGFVTKDTLRVVRGVERGGWHTPRSRDSWTLKRAAEAEAAEKPAEEKQVEVRGAGDLKALPDTLESLWIRGQGFDGEDCEQLIRFSKLRSLEWSSEAVIPESAYEHLGKLKSLESLKLIGRRDASDEDLRHLAGLTGLKSLSIAGASQITDKGVAHLANLPDLKRLSLHWPGTVTDASMKLLGEHKTLEALHLWGAGRITDAGCEFLSNSKTLSELTLSHGQEITVKGLASLGKLAGLRDIQLGLLSIDDRGLVELGKMSRLERLSLIYMKEITDAGVQGLKELKKLRHFYVRDCPMITDKGIEDLRSGLPGKFVLE